MNGLKDIIGKLMKENDQENKNEKQDFTESLSGEDKELSKRAKLVVEMVAEFNSSNIKKYVMKDRNKTDIERDFVYPEHLTLTKLPMDNFSMELLEWKEPTESKWTIMLLHGGGYIGPFKNNYRMMAGLYSEVGRGAKVLSIDYRTAPDNPYPAALEDALAAYEWLLDNGYDNKNIVLGGDSAGGGLAIALAMYLRDNGKPLPAGIVAMSPWTDLTASGASYTDNKECDPVFGQSDFDILSNSPYIGNDSPRNPYISPAFGYFDNLPPMLIQVGTREMLLDDSETVARKAKEAGVKIRYTKYQGMFHVFQMAAVLMPESKEAWVEVGRFLDAIKEI